MTGFHVEVSGGTAVVTIDRPKANAIDAATSKAMSDTFAALDADAGVRAIILTGAGPKFFSAGWDLSADEEFDSDYGVGGFGGFPELPNRATPVIAAVNGMAVGGGFEIAMAADLIVAADHAQFWLPEPGLGILPDAGAVRLPRLLPPHVARELLLTGRRMDAAEGHRWGLIACVVPADELLAAAHEMATAIANSAPLSIAALLDIERHTANLTVDKAMQSLKSLPSYRRAIDSDDAQEGTAAFNERRPAIWKGH
jgi:crotonobetainyl-CoA hydratase